MACIFILVGKGDFDLVKASDESFYFGNKKGSPRSGPPLEEFTKLQGNLVLWGDCIVPNTKNERGYLLLVVLKIATKNTQYGFKAFNWLICPDVSVLLA